MFFKHALVLLMYLFYFFSSLLSILLYMVACPHGCLPCFRLFLVYFRLFLVHFALRQSRILYILTTNSYFVKPYKLAKNGHKKSAAGNFYTPGRRIVLFFVCFRGYPSIEIIFFCSTAGFASFFGTNSFSRPCLNSALMSSSVISSPT